MPAHLWTIAVVSVAIGANGGVSHAHPGRTDASGGHYNRKTGVYHYHGLKSSSSSSAVTGLSRMAASFMSRQTARSSPPPKKEVKARNYDPNPLIVRITDESVPLASTGRPFKEPVKNLEKEERARKLLNFAQRQVDEGKRKIGVKYLRRIIDDYAETESAPQARTYLRQLRENEPYREWLDKTGKYSVRAMFIRFENDSVYLKREDQRVIAVDVRDLSHADRLYIIDREGLRRTSRSLENNQI